MADAEPEYVTSITPSDVLFGRGSGPNDHEGNIRFRDMVAQRKAEYMATNHRQTKATIAKSIVDAVFASNGRFLKKLEPSEAQKLGLNSQIDIYAVVDDDTIMEKAKQALRQNRDKGTPLTSSSPMGRPKTPPRSTQSTPISSGGGVGGGPRPYSMQGNVPQNNMSRMYHNQQQAMHSHAGPNYLADTDEYETYTAPLDDPEDANLFSRPPMAGGGMPGKRSSLLGARKDGLGRRDSVPLSDIWRRESYRAGESMQMSELMESFKGMSTSEMNSSSDTIGTIEGNPFGASHMSGISNMSVVSMSSGVSMFKSPNSDSEKGASPDGEAQDAWRGAPQQLPAQQSNNFARPEPRESMVPGDMWTSGALNNLLQAPMEGSSILGLDESQIMPRTLQAMDEHPEALGGYMGSSSLSVLRAAEHNSDRILPPERK
eukprot:Nitzschia sp. Nitz4//scaffold4_size323378//296226//297515//NITZ4_000715-RA/size323378-processed-gene-0.391-mRNA-1//-1//CDS//3329553564//8328//frame0